MKESRTKEREWNFKFFKQKTITKERFEEHKDKIIEQIDNYSIFIKNPSLFKEEIHCAQIRDFLENTPRIYNYLKEENPELLKKIAEITEFHEERCKSWGYRGVTEG